MDTKSIIAIQTRIGTTPDGFWGPKSIAACQAHLRALMPDPHPFPHTDQASLTSFYGKPGDVEMGIINFPIGTKYDSQPVKTGRCHIKLAASLQRILERIAATPHSWVLYRDGGYAGIFNNRPMRGGSTPSLHARAAAYQVSFARRTQ